MKSEAAIQQQIRLAAAKRGGALLRNNVGACMDKTGRLIRYGLGNDSAALNRKFKSSDLIGVLPVTITGDMVGQTIGVFWAVECKKPGWRLTPGDERAQAQAKFGQWVHKMGGRFCFATSIEDIGQ